MPEEKDPTLAHKEPITQGSEPARPRAREATFEEALAALEERVRRLDGGDLPLEEALGVFEEGVALVQECHEKLDATERRILELTESPSGLEDRPFEP